MKKYVLMEHGQEYNDEVYYLEESGNPKKIFSCKKKALAECDRLNMERLSGLGINEWAYCISDVLKVHDSTLFVNLWKRMMEDEGFYPQDEIDAVTYDSLNDNFDLVVPEVKDKGLLRELWQMVDLEFFYVVEVDSDE